MKTILVATDLSDRSDIAVSRAAQIALRQDATLHVLHVVDGELPVTLGEAQHEWAEHAILAKLASLKEAGKEASYLKTEASTIFGDPSEDIVLKATEIEADLIVTGRHRRRGLAEFFTGTTVQRMARVSTVPLLVATRMAETPYTAAVVGVDFSNCASRAVSVASQLVGKEGLKFVHSYHIPFRALTMRTDRHGSISASDRERIEAEIRRNVDTWIATCGIESNPREVLLREGSAIDVLPRIANEIGSDLICLGAHSRSWLPSAMLGSTAAELLSYSDFDILIAPL